MFDLRGDALCQQSDRKFKVNCDGRDMHKSTLYTRSEKGQFSCILGVMVHMIYYSSSSTTTRTTDTYFSEECAR